MEWLGQSGGSEKVLSVHAEGGGAMGAQAYREGASISRLLGPEQGNDILPPVATVHRGKASPLLLPLTGSPANFGHSLAVIDCRAEPMIEYQIPCFPVLLLTSTCSL